MKYQINIQCKHSNGQTGSFLSSGEWQGTCYNNLEELFKSGLYKELRDNKEIDY
jgi:hypothetical protein